MTRASTEQLFVQVLLRSSQDLLKALRAEREDGPLRARAAQELELAFQSLWSRVPLLTLTVGPRSIDWEGRSVLVREEDEGGLISSLARAGITSLTLVPGVQSGEMRDFLTCIAESHTDGDGSGVDLLTLLFTADLQHLRYEVASNGAEPVSASAPPLRPRQESVAEAVRRDAADADRARGIVQLEKFDSTLYFLDRSEIEYLKSAIDREYSPDVSVNVLSLLLDTLQLHPEPEVRSEVLEVLKDLMPYLLGTGRFDAVAFLVAGARQVTQEALDLTAPHKQALDDIRTSVSSSRALSQLFHALDDGGIRPTSESMGVLLRELRPGAIRLVLSWSERLTHPETKTAVVDALDAFFTRWPHALARMLAATEQDVVYSALDLALRLKLPDFVELLAGAAGHEDAGTRVRVARTLSAIGTAPALRMLTGLTADRDPDVRIVVYRTLTHRPYRGALKALEVALSGGHLEERGQREKRALFEAYAAVAGQEGVSLFDGVLHGKNPGGGRSSPHTRACAAIALGLVGTPGARTLLQNASDDRDPLVRSAVRSALRGER